MTTTGATGKPCERARDDPSYVLLSAMALSRLRHGLPLWTAAVPPLVLAALLAVTAFPASAEVRDAVWDRWLSFTLFLWAALAPMAAGLFAVGAHQADEEAKRVMYGYGFPRHRLLAATAAAATALWTASALLLTALVAAAALIHGSPGDAAAVLPGTLLPVLAALPTLVLCLVAAEAWGVAGAACTGVAGLLFGALIGDKPYWWVFPPAWPTRSVIPFAETGGLGYFPPGHPMPDPSILPAVAGASAALTAALLIAGAYYTDRREV